MSGSFDRSAKAVGVQQSSGWWFRHGAERMSPVHAGDRNFFLIILVILWSGILAGFIPDILSHMAGGHVKFAAIVHVHAAFFVGWMLLLTTQMSLIRSRRVDVHRRLGFLALLMIPAMTLLGPWTGLVMGRLEFGTPDGDPALLSAIFLDSLNFAVVASAGIMLRRDPVAHRRLMLLATIFISGAAFARWLGGPVFKLMGAGIWPFFVLGYLPVLLLIVAMVVYDMRTRGRLHPAVTLAMVFGVANNVLVCVLHESPAWGAIAARLLGH